MEKPTASIGQRLAELEQRATAAEDAVKALEKRVRILEKGEPQSSPVYVTPGATDSSTIFQARKTDGTLYIDYTFFPSLGRDETKLYSSKDMFEQQLKNVGFKIVNNKQSASEIALVLFFSTVRSFGGEKQLVPYLQQNPNAFIVGLFAGGDWDIPRGIEVVEKARLTVPIYFYQFQYGNKIYGFVGRSTPKPRTSNIASQICTTCCSRHGNNTCNVCQEAFCGMECFAYGHKRCYQ